MNLDKLSKKPEMMQRIIGLKFEVFKIFCKNIELVWKDAEFQRLKKEGRKREIGAGHPYRFKTIEEKVAVVLIYYKTYCTQEFLGCILDVDQATISRLFSKLIPLIEKAADPELNTFLSKLKEECSKEKIGTLEKFLIKYPEFKDISTDATEQECFRSANNEIQKKHYSGKSKKHSIKTQISVLNTGRIINVSNSYPGSVHDITVFYNEETIKMLLKFVPQRFDSGYQGLQARYPEFYIILPVKKSAKKELTRLDKEHNKLNSKRRVIAENVLSRIKKFRILSGVYRNELKNYNQIFRGVAALINFKLENHPKVA